MTTQDLDSIIENIKRGRNAELVTTKQQREILTQHGVKFMFNGSFYYRKFRNLSGGVWLFYAIDEEGKPYNKVPKEYKKTNLVKS